MSWQVVSFFTMRTGYEQEIKKLEASLLKFGFAYKFYSYRPTGTWRGNLNYKSETILKAFDEFPDRDIVFLDADAVVRQYPKLFDVFSAEKKYDIAACFFKYRPESGDPDELLSGTLWIQNGEGGRRLVERWHKLGLEFPGKRHQMCLKEAIARLDKEGRGVRVYRLPFEYTCIFDYGARRGKIPVVEHFQASRRLRRQVGYGVRLIPGKKHKFSIITTRNMRELRRVIAEGRAVRGL
jgi:hypothetical protein